MFSRYLDTVGDGSGAKLVTGDYSETKGRFKIQPPPGYNFSIYRMIVFIEDNGQIAAGGYGAMSALTNGLRLELRDVDGVYSDLLDGIDIQRNADWHRVCHDVAFSDFGAGNNYISVRWTFAKAGEPITLDGQDGERLILTANDDFSDLVDHTFLVQGRATRSWHGGDEETIEDTGPEPA